MTNNSREIGSTLVSPDRGERYQSVLLIRILIGYVFQFQPMLMQSNQLLCNHQIDIFIHE